MQSVQILFNEFSRSVFSSKIDYELFSKLKQQLNQLKLDNQIIQNYLRVIILIYDLSNYEKFYSIKRETININEMALHIKSLVCSSIANVINYFDHSHENQIIFPFNLLSQTVEIMIICSRICLNEGKQFSSEIYEKYKYLHNAFQYVQQNINQDIQFIHHLNIIQIMRFKLQTQLFSILEFEKRINRLFTFQMAQNENYRDFIQNIIVEVLLKSLKNGKINEEKIITFFPYLLEENKKIFQSLFQSCQSKGENNVQGSIFLQIFNQIKIHGVQSISLEYLEDFIKNEENFNDQRIFQIAAITYSSSILQIWFSILNSKKDKNINIQKALNCFIHISQHIILNLKENKENQVKRLIKLSTNVMLTLLTDKKENKTKSSDPLISTIKTLVKIFNFISFNGSEDVQNLRQFAERLCLVCSRYGCIEICKVVYSILLYNCLSQKQKSEQVYQKFIVYHHNQKSNELYKTLKLAYDFQNGSEIGSFNSKSLETQLKKQPFIAILFSKAQEDMIIFEIDLSDFKEVKNKIVIYAEMLKKYTHNKKNIQKILNHMENLFIKFKFQDILSNQQIFPMSNSLSQLKSILSNFLKEKKQISCEQLKQFNASHNLQDIEKSQICFLLLNCLIIESKSLKDYFSEFNFGILLNKFSKHVKIINQITELYLNKDFSINEQFYSTLCSFLFFSLEKFKRQHLKKERIGEPGELIFVHSVADLIKTYLKDSNPPSQNFSRNRIKKTQINYIYFVIFQIDCLSNNGDKYLSEISSIEVDLLKTFNESIFIPKNLKQKILRLIIKESLFSNENSISIKQLKQVIEITENQDEVELYIKCLGSSYGEEGQKLLMLMANKDKRIQKILLKQTEQYQL